VTTFQNWSRDIPERFNKIESKGINTMKFSMARVIPIDSPNPGTTLLPCASLNFFIS
jgi:hypothetical protein